MSRGIQKEPQIAASVVNGVRRDLIEDGTWERIEPELLAKVASLAPWLEIADREDWVALDVYLELMEALRVLLGDAALAAYGKKRLRADVELGPLAPMLRGWIREYGRDPVALLRVAPHAWQAVMRNAGRMVLASSGPGRTHFSVHEAAPLLLRLRGWPVFLEGFGGALLSLSGRQGSLSVVPGEDGASLELVAVWSEG